MFPSPWARCVANDVILSNLGCKDKTMHLGGRWQVLHIPPWSEADNCPGKVAGQVPRVKASAMG